MVGIYKSWRGLETVAGFGREFEEHHDFWDYRFALEYEFEITKLVPTVRFVMPTRLGPSPAAETATSPYYASTHRGRGDERVTLEERLTVRSKRLGGN